MPSRMPSPSTARASRRINTSSRQPRSDGRVVSRHVQRRALAVVFCAAFVGACASTVSAPAPASAPTSLRRQTVAVFPFANDGVSGHERLDFLREWLADSLAATLQSSAELRVVERRELVKILQEQKLGSSELAPKERRLHPRQNHRTPNPR